MKTTPTIIALAFVINTSQLAFASTNACPPEERHGSAITDDAPTFNKAVSTHNISHINLNTELVNFPNRQLRFRTITIGPGGHVKLHSHTNRPAYAIVTQGEVVEYSNLCAVPVVHGLHAHIRESLDDKHYVVNQGKTAAVLTVTDIINQED